MNSIKNFLKSHLILAIIFGLLIFITGILVITALSLKDTVEVDIRVAPLSATVEIDGRTYDNGTFRLPRGELSVHIAKDGFVTQDFVLDTNKSRILYAYLEQTDGTYSWYEEHIEDALELDFIVGKTATSAQDSYSEKHPIMDVLPIIYANYADDGAYTEYRIDGGNFEGCTTDFCLKVTDSTGGNFDAARAAITDAGFDPADFEILYELTPIEPLD